MGNQLREEPMKRKLAQCHLIRGCALLGCHGTRSVTPGFLNDPDAVTGGRGLQVGGVWEGEQWGLTAGKLMLLSMRR